MACAIGCAQRANSAINSEGLCVGDNAEKVCAEATLASGTFTSSSGVTAGAASDSVVEGATGAISATEESVVPNSTGVVESTVGCSVLGVVGVSFDDSVVDSVVDDESVVGCSVVPGVVSVVGVSTKPVSVVGAWATSAFVGCSSVASAVTGSNATGVPTDETINAELNKVVLFFHCTGVFFLCCAFLLSIRDIDSFFIDTSPTFLF